MFTLFRLTVYYESIAIFRSVCLSVRPSMRQSVRRRKAAKGSISVSDMDATLRDAANKVIFLNGRAIKRGLGGVKEQPFRR